CSRQRDPQATFDHAREASRRGDMVAATNEAERGYGTFHSLSAEWAWKFTILRASALHGRGMDEEALKILSSEPTPIPPGELAIKKRRLEGQAYTSLPKFDEALDWANAARQISVAHGYADISQTALGNMGWAYYKLGDSEKAQVALIE